MEAYVRTNLLPYDFALTGEQTAELLAAVVAGTEIDGTDDLFSYERCNRMRDTAEEMIERWRDEYLKAEEVRREALVFVPEFFAMEATPEDLQKLRDRFNISHPEALEEELERRIRVWLSGLPNGRLAVCTNAALRDLIFSGIRSWC